MTGPLSSVLTYTRQDRRAVVLIAAIITVSASAWVAVVAVPVPASVSGEVQVYGAGLALTAYVLGSRHAFDPDHIAAIDNVTRTLVTRRRPAHLVGFWFALGHSSVVLLLTVLVACGARLAAKMASDDSQLHQSLALAGTLASGTFLLFLGLVNIGSLRRARRPDAPHVGPRGPVGTALGGLLRRTTRPGQMYAVGLLFGLGFDTATEVSLLVLAAAGAAGGLPWYALLLLPLLFACGMTLLDTLDGLLMGAAYHWAAEDPARRRHYNVTVTALSVAVAIGIGTIQLTATARDALGLADPVTSWVAGVDLGVAGYAIVVVFGVGWWVTSRLQRRNLDAPPPSIGSSGTPDGRRLVQE